MLRVSDPAFTIDVWNSPEETEYYADRAKIGLWVTERLLIGSYFQKTDHILDIGCGAGRTTLAMYGGGYESVVGVDYSSAMIEKARTLASKADYEIPFHVGDETELQFDEEAFDACLFSAQGMMTIPGAANRLKAIREVYRVLVPGGLFIFTTHDRELPTQFADRWIEERKRWSTNRQDPRLIEFGDITFTHLGLETFVHIPDRNEIASQLEAAGFEIVMDEMRSNLGDEPAVVEDFSVECRMWVVRKPERVS